LGTERYMSRFQVNGNDKLEGKIDVLQMLTTTTESIGHKIRDIYR
jgi:hypothetical protein